MSKPKVKKVVIKLKPMVTLTSKKGAPDHAPNIEWAKNPDWTWSIITYLTDHPNFHVKLFADSTEDAKKEGCIKAVAKDGKPQQYAVLAKHIFENEPTQEKSYKGNPGRFGTSVETCFRRLKKEYSEFVKELGATGAGLDPDDVEEGTDIANLVDSIVERWPWWKEFHSFWCELPNYNPIRVTSLTPGTDHAADASALFDPAPEEADEVKGETGQANELVEDMDIDADKAKFDNDDNDDNDEQDEIDESEDKVIIKKQAQPQSPLGKILKNAKGSSILTSIKAKAVSSGRDAGLVKAHANAAGKKAEKYKSAAEKFTDFRQTEADRIERKREQDHELKMAEAGNKHLKQEYKNRAAEQERAARTEELCLQNAACTEELRLQIELARLTAAAATTQSAATATAKPSAEDTPVAPTPLVAFNMTQTPLPAPDFGSYNNKSYHDESYDGGQGYNGQPGFHSSNSLCDENGYSYSI